MDKEKQVSKPEDKPTVKGVIESGDISVESTPSDKEALSNDEIVAEVNALVAMDDMSVDLERKQHADRLGLTLKVYDGLLAKARARHKQSMKEARDTFAIKGSEYDLYVQEENFNTLIDRYIYANEQDRFYDHATGSILSSKALDNTFLADYDEPPISKRLLKSHKSTKVNNFTWEPSDKKIITQKGTNKRMVNTYRPSGVIPEPGDITPWMDLNEKLFPNKRERDAFLDWQAFTLQRPNEKCNFQPLMGSYPRAGKDGSTLPLQMALGMHNVENIRPRAVQERFSEFLAGKKLIIIQEVKEANNKAMQEDLKPLCAAPPLFHSVDVKGIRPFQVPNIVALVVFTNHRQPMPIDADNSRYLALWSDYRRASKILDPAKYEQEEEEYRRYYNWVKQEKGAEYVAHYLLNRDISNFNPGALPLQTAWGAEISGFSKDDIVLKIERMIDEKDEYFLADIVRVKDLLDLPEFRREKEKRLEWALKQAGCVARRAEGRVVDPPSTEKSKITRKLWVVRKTATYTNEQTMPDTEFLERWIQGRSTAQKHLSDKFHLNKKASF